MWQLGVFGITIGRLNLSTKSDFEGFSCFFKERESLSGPPLKGTYPYNFSIHLMASLSITFPGTAELLHDHGIHGFENDLGRKYFCLQEDIKDLKHITKAQDITV